MSAEVDILQSPRYLAGTLGDLEIRVYRDGELTDPASAGTVTVTDEDGNVLSTGAATVVGSGTGLLRYTPTAAAMASVNRLTVSWASVVLGTDPAVTLTSYGEVVGDMLFTSAQARAWDGGAMANQVNYKDDDIARARDRIHDDFEAILGYPLGRRYYREVLNGLGGSDLWLSRSEIVTVRKISERTAGGTTWTDYTATELADVFALRSDHIVREALGFFTRGNQNIRVSYEAGKTIPGPIRFAALRVLRHQLVASDLPDRALFQTTQLGQFRVAVAGEGARWFGLPEVDATLLRYLEVAVA